MAEDWGLKISNEGYDVSTSTGIQTAFKNDSKLLKIALSSTGTVGGTNLVTISHNLGYVPQFLVFCDGGTAGTQIATGDVFDQVIAGSDTADLTIYANNGSHYQYYIFYEKIDGSSYSASVSTNNYGLKVMKPGFDVTSIDLNEQSLNSEKTCLKIALQDTYETTAIDSSYNTVTIPHGLPYTPGYMMFFEIDNDGNYLFGTSGTNISYNYVDDTNIYFTYFDLTTGTSIKCSYILFVENA